jgi:hypothetical protein
MWIYFIDEDLRRFRPALAQIANGRKKYKTPAHGQTVLSGSQSVLAEAAIKNLLHPNTQKTRQTPTIREVFGIVAFTINTRKPFQRHHPILGRFEIGLDRQRVDAPILNRFMYLRYGGVLAFQLSGASEWYIS